MTDRERQGLCCLCLQDLLLKLCLSLSVESLFVSHSWRRNYLTPPPGPWFKRETVSQFMTSKTHNFPNFYPLHIYVFHNKMTNDHLAIKVIRRSSADADNGLNAFSGQSRSTNIVPFHMLHIVSYCAIVTLSLRRAVFTIFDFKKCHDLEMGVKGHSRSFRVVSFDRLCIVSY